MAGVGSAPGRRQGGRQKGAANRRTTDLIEQLEALGLDPVAELAAAMQAAKDEGDLGSWINAAKALLPYMYPRRRSVDITSNSGPLTLQVVTGVPSSKKIPDEAQALLDKLGTLRDSLSSDE